MSVIALKINSAASVADYTASLGQILVSDGEPFAIGKVQNLAMQNKMSVEGGDIRLYWEAPASGDVHHYDLYIDRNGERTLAGQTKNCAFYFEYVTREGENDEGPIIEVVPVSYNQVAGEKSVLTDSKFPEPTSPNVFVETSESLVAPGTEVTFKAVADQFPESYEWILPAGATNMVISEDATEMTCILNTLGMTDVQVNVTNGVGTTEYVETALVEVSNNTSLSCVSVGKTIDDASYNGSHEGPHWLIDGVTVPGSTSEKWCTSSTNPWVIIDLEKSYKLYRFEIFDCQLKEGGANCDNYDIEVSIDKVNWTKVVSKTDNGVKHHIDWCKPTIARYIRWNIFWENPETIRVWEFQAYGEETGVVIDAIDDQDCNVNETKLLEVAYSFEGEPCGADFSYNVTCESDAVEISNVAADEYAKKISFDVTGKFNGLYPITISITNNGVTKTSVFNLRVIDSSLPNLLLNGNPVFAQRKVNSGWSDITAEKAALFTDGDKTTGYKTSSFVNGECMKIVYDLNKYYNLSQIDAYIGGGFSAISIETSIDNRIFNTVYDGASKLENHLYPLENTVRYIRFSLDQEEYAAHDVFEFEAYGEEVNIEDVDKLIPLEITAGFNADVIAESKPASASTSAVLDNQGWVYFATALQADGAIDNSEGNGITSSKGTPFVFAPYDENNALSFKSVSTGEISFSTTPKAKELYFLSTSADGSSRLETTVNYTDGTSEASVVLNLDDWFGNENDKTAKTGVYRIKAGSGSGYFEDDIDSRSFRLFEHKLTTNPDKSIKSVSFNKSGEHPALFAVTMLGKLSTPTGVDRVQTENNIFVYPNPLARGEVLTIESEKNAIVQVVDLRGSLLKEQIITNGTTAISMDSFNSGVYLIVVKTKTNRQVRKVILK